jgi:TM2 domain-containing membrane protein YozV
MAEKQADETFCSSCGANIKREEKLCPICGVRQINVSSVADSSEKKWKSALYFTFFFGNIGLHRFYCKKKGLGILSIIITLIGAVLYTSSNYLSILGFLIIIGMTIWSIVDFLLILNEKYKDKQGNIIRKYI